MRISINNDIKCIDKVYNKVKRDFNFSSLPVVNDVNLILDEILSNIIKLYKELCDNNIEVQLYEHERITNVEFLENLVETYYEIMKNMYGNIEWVKFVREEKDKGNLFGGRGVPNIKIDIRKWKTINNIVDTEYENLDVCTKYINMFLED